MDLAQEQHEWDLREQLHKERPQYFAGHGMWPRFSNYEIRTEKGIRDKDRTTNICKHCGWSRLPLEEYSYLAICPAKDASLTWYKPFDLYPGILFEFIDLAASLSRDSEIFESEYSIKKAPWIFKSESDITSPVLSRSNKMTDVWIKDRIERDGPRLLNFYTKYGQITGAPFKKDYYSDFLNWGKRLAILNPKKLKRAVKLGTLKKDYDSWVHSVLRDNAEDIRLTYASCYHLKFWVDLWQEYCATGNNADGFRNDQTPWASVFDRCIAPNITLKIRPRRKTWQIDYDFDQLFHAIMVMFLLNISSEKNQIRICALPECGRPFLSANPRARYCCNSHAVRSRVRKFRSGQKSVVISEGELSTKQGKTRGKSRKA
ncbi:MAG: CGNR zinc finger domain-containing protein [Acidobacteria bacterium]|nr:CGNR zinc finger domain-containing protein [Acidobacteriota bacterium]